MTIASSNVSFSAIAGEKGIGTSNLSLATLAGGQMKLPVPTDSSSTSSEYGTFDQTWYYGGDLDGRTGSTVTSTQGQGVNGLNASPHSMSEWVGFDPATDGYSIIGQSTFMAVHTTKNVTDSSCFVVSGCGNDIYCQKVGSDIRIYVTEVTSGVYTSDSVGKNHANSGTAFTGTTEIGRITAGTGQSLPTTCDMDYTTLTNSTGGGYLGGGTITTISGGSDSTNNLGSTKIGYRVQCGGVSEAGPGTSGYARFYNGIRFEFGGMTGVTGTATIQVQLNLEAYANHGSGFQSC
jgi:hypothetical protein